MGWVQPIELPGGGTTRTFASPLRMRNQSFGISRRPPALGEHTEEVLAKLGKG
jgi:crotonobetainyl-CoA:carnitine CoA-transferase CaiB-like acyl-CoA transferase